MERYKGTVRQIGPDEPKREPNDGSTRTDSSRKTIMPATNALNTSDLDLPIPLMSGGQATLRIPRPMSGEDYDYMKDMLESMLAGMRKAIIAPTTKTETPRGYDSHPNINRES